MARRSPVGALALISCCTDWSSPWRPRNVGKSVDSSKGRLSSRTLETDRNLGAARAPRRLLLVNIFHCGIFHIACQRSAPCSDHTRVLTAQRAGRFVEGTVFRKFFSIVIAL